MRKLPIVSGTIIAAALVVAACGGAAPASTRPSIPPINIPSITIPSFAIPSLGLGSFAIPSFAGDPELAAKFPKTINGATVSPPETVLYAAVIAAFAGNGASAKFAQAIAAIGGNPATMSYGRASVDLNESEDITALRSPGFAASQVLAVAPQLAVLLNPDKPAPTVSQETIGGKSVTVLTDVDGDKSYFYASGDTLWETDATDPDDLSAIFGAIQ